MQQQQPAKKNYGGHPKMNVCKDLGCAALQSSFSLHRDNSLNVFDWPDYGRCVDFSQQPKLSIAR
jgi:hypothetical protein